MSDIQPLIELTGVTKTFATGGPAVTVLGDIDLSIYEGEFVAIVGASGSGKSTLMNLLGCLDRPTAGSYRFAGRDIAGLDDDQLAALRSKTFGFVFQRYNLIATATASENVEIPAVYAGVPAGTYAERARRLLARLGLDAKFHRWPNQLSGGEQQRVSIARALMNGGRVILADEPSGALDSKNGAEVMEQLLALHRAGHTLVLVTHDPNLAALAERRVEIKDGRIVSDTGPVIRRPTQPARASGGTPPGGGLAADILDAVKAALRSLRANVFRTALTLLGIIIGVGAVVTMVALGEGSKEAVLSRIEAMGTDLLVVQAGKRNVRTREEKAALVPEDAEALEGLPNVLRVAPEYSKAVVVRAGEYDLTTTCITTTGGFAAARNWPALHGAFFSEADVQSYAPVVVLGQAVAAAVFPDVENPVGSNLLINNISFQVVGVLTAKGASASGSDMDDAVFLPLTTGRMRLFGKPYVKTITVQVADVGRMDHTAQAIRSQLSARHGREDFQVRNMASLLEAASKTQDTLTLLLSSIAAISLLVGGIGVMNIMLVSVTERVREIGVRMAVGARVSQILLHFVVEALVVCSVGGAIGILAGLGAARVAEGFGMPVVYSAWSVLLAFASAMATGLIFGFLPARRAARLDPVVALSAE